MSNLTHLSDLDMLEAALAESRERPVLLFKHSRTCGISCEALDELHAHLEQAGTDAVYKMVVVQNHRRVSDTVSQRLGVRHETPQAILIKGGAAVWNASHFRITAAEIGRVLRVPDRRSTSRPPHAGARSFRYHNHAAPRTPLESPCRALTSRVATWSENTYCPTASGRAGTAARCSTSRRPAR